MEMGKGRKRGVVKKNHEIKTEAQSIPTKTTKSQESKPRKTGEGDSTEKGSNQEGKGETERTEEIERERKGKTVSH